MSRIGYLRFFIYNIVFSIGLLTFPIYAGDFDSNRDLSRAEIEPIIEEAYDLNIEWHPDTALAMCFPLVERARTELGETDSTYARALEVVATCYYYLGEYGRSEELFKEVLRIREAIFKPGDYRIINVILRLGQTYSRQFRFDLAENHLNKASALWESYFGRKSQKYGTTQGELGWVYLENGDFYKAEKYLKTWADISREVLGENHPNYASALHNLGILYYRFGYWEKAGEYYKRAFDIFENAYGPIHPVVARLLMGLGKVQTIQGRYDKAEPYYDRALKIFFEFFREDHPEVANACWRLAELSAFQGNYVRAESLFNRSIEINNTVYGPGNLNACEPRRMLGIMLANHGRYDEGIALIERSLEVQEMTDVHYHYNASSCYYDLGLVYCYKRDFKSARYYFEKQLGTNRGFLGAIFQGASSERKLRYTRNFRCAEPAVYSMAMLDSSSESKNLALDMLLRSKAFVLDAVAAEKGVAYCSDDSDIVRTTGELATVVTEIANLTIAESNNTEKPYYEARLRQLYDSKDSLESILSARCSAFENGPPDQRFMVQDIVDAIPEDAVLLEFARYTPYDFGPTGSAAERNGKARYLAFALNHGGNIKLIDLADAGLVDSLIDKVLTEMETAPAEIYAGHEKQAEATLVAVTSNLYDLVFAPLVSSFAGKTHILISPDDRLSLIPFEILQDPDGSYVVEKYQFSYLSSGRDLLRFEKDIGNNGRTAVVIIDPDFDSPLAPGISDYPLSMVADGGSEFSVPTRGGDCLNAYFGPLPATYVEGEAVAIQLDEKADYTVNFLQGRNASEKALKNLPSPPSVLHISTHGYFCPGSSEERSPRNPLVFSGLALAGANSSFTGERVSGPENEDGILTSLEVSSLNLSGTDLVVLSACRSGTGETVSGEGVFGMRRAFQLAGANSVVMSMWSVPDRETKELMMDFYDTWLSGAPMYLALRESSLRILNERRNNSGAAHPLFWGGFVLVGDYR